MHHSAFSKNNLCPKIFDFFSSLQHTSPKSSPPPTTNSTTRVISQMAAWTRWSERSILGPASVSSTPSSDSPRFRKQCPAAIPASRFPWRPRRAARGCRSTAPGPCPPSWRCRPPPPPSPGSGAPAARRAARRSPWTCTSPRGPSGCVGPCWPRWGRPESTHTQTHTAVG